MRQVRIVVPRQGLATGKRRVVIDVNGFEGTSCQEATRAIEGALGECVQEAKPELLHTEFGVEHVREAQ